jgi:polar amino acid transport system substrate-binding protein
VVSSSSLSSRTDTAPFLKSNGGAGSTAGSAVVFLVVIVCVLSPVAVGAQQAAAPISNPFSGRADVVDEGRTLFNQYCAHCHGTNAYQGERSRDLRRLQLRYGHEAPRVFYETATGGKLEKGMPVWKTVLSDDLLWQIFTFLETVQTPP